MSVVDRSERATAAPAEPWPLVGRGAELAVVECALADGRGVVLVGAPGVGKTRLAREAAALATEHGAYVERLVATRSAQAIPLGVFAHLTIEADPELTVNPIVSLRGQLVELAGTRRLVVVVDDARSRRVGRAAHAPMSSRRRARGGRSRQMRARS